MWVWGGLPSIGAEYAHCTGILGGDLRLVWCDFRRIPDARVECPDSTMWGKQSSETKFETTG